LYNLGKVRILKVIEKKISKDIEMTFVTENLKKRVNLWN